MLKKQQPETTLYIPVHVYTSEYTMSALSHSDSESCECVPVTELMCIPEYIQDLLYRSVTVRQQVVNAYVHNSLII